MSPAGGGGTARRICVATTGFLVLSRCGRPAHAGCTRCGRSICPTHSCSVPETGEAGMCPECYAAARGVLAPDDDFWAYGYRRNFYWEASQSTGDDLLWSDFDSFDQQAFDPAVAGEGDFADYDDAGDLVDS